MSKLNELRRRIAAKEKELAKLEQREDDIREELAEEDVTTPKQLKKKIASLEKEQSKYAKDIEELEEAFAEQFSERLEEAD